MQSGIRYTVGAPGQSERQPTTPEDRQMTIEQLEAMIEEITKDIRHYQEEKGAWVVFDPTSDAHRLVGVKIKLIRQARKEKGLRA